MPGAGRLSMATTQWSRAVRRAAFVGPVSGSFDQMARLLQAAPGKSLGDRRLPGTAHGTILRASGIAVECRTHPVIEGPSEGRTSSVEFRHGGESSECPCGSGVVRRPLGNRAAAVVGWRDLDRADRTLG